MPENGKTIYKICREQAGYTQEHAAELLHISVRALSRYESGETEVPNDVVAGMVMLYNDNFVAVSHVLNSFPPAVHIIPALEPCDFLTGSIRVFNQLDRAREERPELELLKIAEDGRITPDEIPKLDLILSKLNDMVKVFTELRLSAEREMR